MIFLVPFEILNNQEEKYSEKLLHKVSDVPLQIKCSSGRETAKIKLKLPKPAIIKKIIIKNCNSMFITVVTNDILALVKKTQLYSFDQMQGSKQTTKIKFFNCYPSNEPVEFITILLQGWYDIEKNHAVGLHWIELYS